MKKKVLFISPVSYFKGGAERSLFDLLKNPYIEPILAVPEDGPILKKAKEMGIKTYTLDFGRINSIRRPFSFFSGIAVLLDLIRAIRQVKSIVNDEEITVIHSNGLKAHILNCLSCLVSRQPKSVIHIRDIPYTKSEKLVWSMMYHLCDSMILVSKACWPNKIFPEKTRVIHNGTNIRPNATAKIDREDNKLTIGFIGRIHPAKGLHVLLEWLHELKDRDLDLVLSVRGTYSDDAPNYKAEIEDYICRYELKDCVEFTGFIDDTDRLYEGINVVVVPSMIPDPLPRSIMESMAYGVPVFGYPAGGIFEMIDDGKTGYLVSNSIEFCESISQIVSSRDKLEEIVRNAKFKIETEFTIPLLHQKTNSLYETLLSS